MNSFKKTARRLKPAFGYLMPARESTLTFAAIWDPDRGLQTYAGQDLLSQKSEKGSKPLVGNRDSDDEPFAVFGSRTPYFIDVRTSSAYERWVRGSSGGEQTEESPSKSNNAAKPVQRPRRDRQRHLRVDSVKANEAQQPVSIITPGSKLTFAALWDPETGITAFQDGQPIKAADSKGQKRWPCPSGSSSTLLQTNSLPPPPKPTLTLNLADFDYTKPGLYLPRSSTPCPGFRSAIPSSAVEGNHDPWNYSCFDPLRHHNPPFNPSRPFSPFSRDSRTPTAQELPSDFETKLDFSEGPSFEDEGFFDGYDHPDCEPHLPSRFSTTTTSTSTYIAVEFAPTEPPTPMPPPPPPKDVQKAPPAYPTPTTKNRLTRAKSFPAKLPELRRERKPSITAAVPRLPNVFRKARVKALDDRWVLVEVQSVITERMVAH